MRGASVVGISRRSFFARLSTSPHTKRHTIHEMIYCVCKHIESDMDVVPYYIICMSGRGLAMVSPYLTDRVQCRLTAKTNRPTDRPIQSVIRLANIFSPPVDVINAFCNICYESVILSPLSLSGISNGLNVIKYSI